MLHIDPKTTSNQAFDPPLERMAGANNDYDPPTHRTPRPMKKIFVITALCLGLLDQAQWAYDKDNRILRLCVEIEQSSESDSATETRLRCTTFPREVFLSPMDPFI